MGSFGGFEMAIIVLIILLLFGAKKIPELARGLGQGINEFKKASNEIRSEIETGVNENENNRNSKTGPENKEKTAS